MKAETLVFAASPRLQILTFHTCCRSNWDPRQQQRPPVTRKGRWTRQQKDVKRRAGWSHVQVVGRWSRTSLLTCPPQPAPQPAPQQTPPPLSLETMRQQIKGSMFSVWMRNKCCFDRNTSGQASSRCPQHEPAELRRLSSALSLPPLNPFFLWLFYHLTHHLSAVYRKVITLRRRLHPHPDPVPPPDPGPPPPPPAPAPGPDPAPAPPQQPPPAPPPHPYPRP